MEELAGPDKLEREIFDDAAKKAQGLVDAANAEAARIRDAVKADCEKAIRAMEAESAKRVERHAAEARERVPLERTRIRTAYLDGLLAAEGKAFLESLSPEDMGRLVRASFARARAYFEGKPVVVRYARMEEGAVRKAAEALGAASIALEREDGAKDEGATAYAEGATLRATIRELSDVLLLERRGELARALCPGVWKA